MKHLIIGITAALFSFATQAADRPADKPAPTTASSSDQAAPTGAGMGRHHRWKSGPRHNPGWGMLTPEEREQHMQKMHGLKNIDECRAYLDEHHKLIENRAKEKNQPMPRMKGDACQRMEKRGMFAK